MKCCDQFVNAGITLAFGNSSMRSYTHLSQETIISFLYFAYSLFYISFSNLGSLPCDILAIILLLYASVMYN